MKRLLIRIFILSVGAIAVARGQWVKLSSTRGATPQISLGNITVSATPATVNLTLVPGGRSAISPTLTITSAESLSVLTNFSLYAFFATPSALIDNAGDAIPSSAVFAQCPNGVPTSWQPFTQSGPFAAGSSLLLYQTSSLATLLANKTQTCNILVDLTSLPQLPAGSYSGNLVIQAQAL